jgi:anthranilate/para-aminobenzoate synthase component I
MNYVKAHEDGPYWDRACQFFRDSGLADSEGSYLIHNKNSKTVKIGTMCKRVAVMGHEGDFSYVEDGQEAAAISHAGDPIFKHVEKLVSPDAPCFFIVSPDIRRGFIDESLPQILLVQPGLEFTFSPDRSDGEISYAQDAISEGQGDVMLRASAGKPLSVQDPPADRPSDGEPRAFSDLAAGWTPAEDDESFLGRLTNAVDLLQAHPDGKMAPTRAYERRLPATYDPFSLYELHARRNGDYACSHFVCIRKGVFSLGTTPENIFEVSDRTLTVDVVAGTCKFSEDDAYLARELYENPKQIKEHKSSFANRQNRFRPFCKEGSIHEVQDIQVKVLRNVCHLHSVFTGELLPDVTIFDLMENIFPLLGARPRELLPIADAEPAPHRFYGGIVGHVHRNRGGGFLNIRSALLDNDVMHAKVGTGVISESDAYSELMETRNKLSGLLEAVLLWEQSGSLDRGSDVGGGRS